jgi:hypothetical protein
MAKDQVTRESWWKDETFLSLVSELASTKIKQDSFSHAGYTFSDHYFKEAEYYYRSPPDGFAFFHRAVKVKGSYHYYKSANYQRFFKKISL